jgi:hypothetical protein
MWINTSEHEEKRVEQVFGIADASHARSKFGEDEMFKRAWLLALALVVVCWTVLHAQQHPIVDAIAKKVVQKYQQSSCDQLLKQKSEPKTPLEEKAVELLRHDPQVRTEFLDKVAAPIANKMFECGLIP